MVVRISVVAAICILLSGCGLFGFWMNGNPAVGENITPTRDYWILPGGTVEERQRQWVACGGRVDGIKASGIAIPEEAHLSTKEMFEASWARDRKLYACMVDKGYRYIGRCQGSATTDIPVCQKNTMRNVPSVNNSNHSSNENLSASVAKGQASPLRGLNSYSIGIVKE